MTVEQRVLNLLERAVQGEPGSVRPSMRLAELQGWDSMGVVDFLGNLYDELGVTLSVDRLQTLTTVQEVVSSVGELVR